MQVECEDGADKAGEDFVEPAAGTVMTLDLNGETKDSFLVKNDEMKTIK